MNTSTSLENQLLSTKLFVPVASGTLIPRPRLTALLQESLHYPLTLVSAPAGFGKTTLLSTWVGSLQVPHPLVAWVSLDEDDNDPWLFWNYVLTALERQQPGRFEPLLTYLHSQPSLPLKYLLKTLLNLLADNAEDVVLILDDYYLITEEQVYTTVSYLVEHLPPQFHIILATRADPPLPFPVLRARGQVLEVRTEQLRCTSQETEAFFQEVMGLQLPQETIQQITTRMEGWLVGMQLLGLSLPERADPLRLLEEASGDQRYILDYLTEQVLRQQPQEVQTFLLSTSILEHFTASLCDTLIEQTNSEQILRWLEQANVFVVSLDSKQEWYRYHRLFAQALRHQLEQRQDDLVFHLHHRASIWYAQHDFPTQAILHALHAKQWHWAADLIEGLPSLLAHTWGASEHELASLRYWLEQLPTEIVHSRPRLCLICAELLWLVTPGAKLQDWLNAAKATLTAWLTKFEDSSDPTRASQARQDQEDLLGEVIAFRAMLESFEGKREATHALYQQALALLSAKNSLARGLLVNAQLIATYPSAAYNAIEHGLHMSTLAQQAGKPATELMGTTAMCMVGAGRLHEAQRLAQQALRLGRLAEGLMSSEASLPMIWQAYLLCEWNQLDAARSLAEEAILLCKQIALLPSLVYLLFGYAVLLHIHLSRADLNAAQSTLQEFEQLGRNMYQPTYLYVRSHFTTVDQVRLWLANGEFDRASRWAKEVDLEREYSPPFVQEREEIACVRILLANKQLASILERLEPMIEKATTAQRWSHVIEMRLLQAQARMLCSQVPQALSALREAVRLAEPEGYIRSFVDEGPAMATLLSRLRKEQEPEGSSSYVDTVLAAFPQGRKTYEQPSKGSKTQPLLDPLSEREQEILQLVVQGASNHEIAQELVIAIDTVKRHVSHILSKLGVKNRIQAVRQARELGLLSEEH